MAVRHIQQRHRALNMAGGVIKFQLIAGMIKTKRKNKMSAPIYSNIIDKVFHLLDQDLNSYVYDGYTALASHLQYPLGLAVILYFSIMGLSISQGWVQLSMGVFTKAIIKISLIYMFAMHWGNFNQYVIGGIEKSAGQIGDWLVNASPVAIPNFSGSGINGALQTVLTEVTRLGAWVWGKGSISNWSPFFCAVCIWIFGFISLVMAVVEIILANMMLAILFSLAPLFIGFTLFKPTHGMFDRWVGSICGFALFLIMIPAVVMLGLSFIQFVIQDQYSSQAADITLVDWVPIMIAGLINLTLILKISDYAKSIGGSISIGSGSAMLAGAVGGFVGGALSSVNIAKHSGVASGHVVSGVRSGLSKSANFASNTMNVIRGKLRGGE